MKIKQMIIMFGIFLFAFGITGCSNDAQNPELDDVPEDDTIQTHHDIMLMVTSIQFNGVLYPLENNKVSKPDNIDVELVKTDYNQGELYTLSTNKPTIGILSNVNVGKAYLKGEKFKVLAPYYKEIVGPYNYDTGQLEQNTDSVYGLYNQTMGQVVVNKNSDITSPKDLEGKTVGIQGAADGSTIAMMTSLRKIHQVDLDKVDFKIVESNMAPVLLDEGKLDASMFDSDYILTESFDEKYKLLFDFNKDMYEFYGTVPPASFFVVRQDIYEKNPEVYNKVIDYFSRAYDWYQNNAEEVSRMEAEATGQSYDLIYLKSKYEQRAGKVTERDIAAFNDFYDTAIERGVLSEKPNISELFNLK